MTAVLYLGGRLDSVEVVAGTPTEVTTAGTFDSSYCDAALACNNSTHIWAAKFRDSAGAVTTLTTGQTGYFHCEFYPQNVAGTPLHWWLVDASGNPWLSLRGVTTGNYGFYYNSNTGASPTWTLIGSTFALTGATRVILDIELTLGSPHSAKLYIGSGLSQSGTFTQAALTALQAMRGSGSTGGNANYCFSQLMATEGISTIGGKVKYSRATGAGGNSGWTGAHIDVNEAINSDASTNTAATAALRQTYAMGDVTVPAGLAIKSVFHALRAKNDGVAPNNIKSALLLSATNYDASANLPGIGTGFAPLIERYDTNPATGLAWTQAEWNAAEAGYLSAT
jgi:hypothetical protein